MDRVRVRFAPSPTGLPHVGNIRTALFNYLFARHHQGTFVFRIEDTDRSRFVEGAIEKLTSALEWVGIEIDEGYSAGGEFGPYLQSQRLDLYEDIASQMIAKGKAYVCNCSLQRLEQLRAEQRKAKLNPKYDGHCRHKNIPFKGLEQLSQQNAVLRFAAPQEGQITYNDKLRGEITFDNRQLDDIVLVKADGFPTYNFANVVDDHFMNITHVMRGDEFISSTPKHVHLYNALDWTAPEFIHLPIILNQQKKRLSKRDGSVYIGQYREMGILPSALRNFLALLGWSPKQNEEIMDMKQLIERFSISGITIHPAIFDLDKLIWINSQYIASLPGEDLFNLAEPFMKSAGIDTSDIDLPYAEQAFDLLKSRLPTLQDVPERVGYFFHPPEQYEQEGWEKRILKVDHIQTYLSSFIENLKSLDCWNRETVESCLRETAESLKVKPSILIHAARISVTGMTTGPGLFDILNLLGKEQVVSRMEKAIKKIAEQV
ncbi:MAG: glutamate--tRNA ligase [bacterium]